MSRVNKPALCAPRDLRARTAERARNDTQKATESQPAAVLAALDRHRPEARADGLPVVMLGGAGTWAYQTGWFGMMGDKATGPDRPDGRCRP